MIKIAVYQHRVLPTKALVTQTKNNWVEFYIEDHENLSYLEESVFLAAYQLYNTLDRPLYTEQELTELRKTVRSQGIQVPPVFD